MAYSVSKKYNTEKVFNVATENFEYKSLEELYIDNETVYVVKGIYINNKGMFGAEPVLATDEFYINLPNHLTDTCKEMIADRQAVWAINAGEVGITIYKYFQKKYNKECYGIKWVDVDTNM